jgi:hypothetical protein
MRSRRARPRIYNVNVPQIAALTQLHKRPMRVFSCSGRVKTQRASIDNVHALTLYTH